MKKLRTYNIPKSFLSHDDGSMVSMEEIEEALQHIPLNEGRERLQEIHLDCTIEEFMQQNNCVFADVFDNKVDNM